MISLCEVCMGLSLHCSQPLRMPLCAFSGSCRLVEYLPSVLSQVSFVQWSEDLHESYYEFSNIFLVSAYVSHLTMNCLPFPNSLNTWPYTLIPSIHHPLFPSPTQSLISVTLVSLDPSVTLVSLDPSLILI